MAAFRPSPSGSGITDDSGRGSSIFGSQASPSSASQSDGLRFEATSGLDQIRGRLGNAYDRASDAAEQIGDTMRQGFGRLDAGARDLAGRVGDSVSDLRQRAAGLEATIGSTLATADSTGSRFSSALMGASLMSKMLFLIAVVVAFFVLVTIGTAIISSLTSYSRNPMLLSNLKPGTSPMIISQDPRTPHSVPLLRSKNEAPGIEFTYSTWIFVDDVPAPRSLPSAPRYRHIFHKGSTDSFDSSGLSQPVNSPGLYLVTSGTEGRRQKVDLEVVMSTFDDPLETVTIHDVPLNKWLNVVIMVKGQVLDVYINGTIAGRHVLQGVPMQSYGPLNMSLNGGFNGRMSTTQYFAYALSPVQIANLASVHPSLTEQSGGLANPFPQYLSLRWYTGSDAI